MAYNTLTLEIKDAIATITLSRPEKRNAISSAMLDEMPAALAEIAKGPTRVAILTGAGKAFCSGMDLEDLKALASNTPEQNLEDSRRMMRMFHSLYTFPKPLIAAVNGAAIAGGCILSTLCDFTLAVPGTKFGYTEVRISPALHTGHWALSIQHLFRRGRTDTAGLVSGRSRYYPFMLLLTVPINTVQMALRKTGIIRFEAWRPV